MPHVLQICLSPSEGGLELSTLHFSQMLSTEGTKSPVFCLKDSFIDEKAKARGIKAITTSKSLLRQVWDLYHELKSGSYDCVFLHRLKDIRLIPMIKFFFPKLKVVGLAHIYVDRSKQDFFHRFQYSYFDRLISFTKVQSLALQKTLPISSEKHVIIPHGIDPNRFLNLSSDNPNVQKKRKDLEVEPDQTLIGVVGRFDPQKGQLELVDAALELLQQYKKLVFVFVGEDTFNEPGTKQKCQDKVQQSGYEKHFRFLPFTNEIQYFYPALDLFVMPSYKETFGLVLIEAMSCGCPVLSTNAGGPVEILGEGKYGILVEPKSAKGLSEGITQFLQNPELKKELSQKARERVVTTYNQELMQSQLSQFLLQLSQS